MIIFFSTHTFFWTRKEKKNIYETTKKIEKKTFVSNFVYFPFYYAKYEKTKEGDNCDKTTKRNINLYIKFLNNFAIST